jgi:hypothetical protein
MSRTIRVWLDELLRLPEYSTSIPTGVYPGKQWRAKLMGEDNWWIGMFGDSRSDGTTLICWHKVVLLHGPRRGDERSRLSPNGQREGRVQP